MAPMYRGQEKLNGKTVIITGCNTGIGLETARDMARRGARVLMACRSLDKASVARDDVVKTTGNSDVVVKKLDLSSFASIKAFCQDINSTESRIDILINNAGLGWIPYQTTADGLEMQMGTNHFGHYLMTMLLLDKIKACAPSRIVVLASEAHRWGDKLDLDDVRYGKKNYGNQSRYGQSKQANMLFALELSKRLAGTGVNVYAVQPGTVDSDLFRNANAFLKAIMFPLKKLLLKTVVEGAQTTIYCALSPELANVTGKYYDDCKEKRPAPRALDENDAKRLWQISEEVTGVSDRPT